MNTLADAQQSFDVKGHKAALESVYDAAEKAFAQHNPARLDQLRSTLGAAEMALDHLATETPYIQS